MSLNLNIDLDDLSLDNIGSWPVAVQIAACSILAITIFIAGYLLDTKHQLVELKSAQRTEVKLRKEFEEKQHQSASLDAYKLQLAEIRKSFGQLLRQLPSKTEIPGLLEDISKTGIAAGLEFKLFDPLEEVRHDFYAELPIRIIVVGDYHQFGDFVSRIAGLGRIVTLHDFKIEKNSKSSGKSPKKSTDLLRQHHLVMEMMAKTYRYVDEKEGGQNVKKK